MSAEDLPGMLRHLALFPVAGDETRDMLFRAALRIEAEADYPARLRHLVGRLADAQSGSEHWRSMFEKMRAERDELAAPIIRENCEAWALLDRSHERIAELADELAAAKEDAAELHADRARLSRRCDSLIEQRASLQSQAHAAQMRVRELEADRELQLGGYGRAEAIVKLREAVAALEAAPDEATVSYAPPRADAEPDILCPVCGAGPNDTCRGGPNDGLPDEAGSADTCPFATTTPWWHPKPAAHPVAPRPTVEPWCRP